MWLSMVPPFTRKNSLPNLLKEVATDIFVCLVQYNRAIWVSPTFVLKTKNSWSLLAGPIFWRHCFYLLETIRTIVSHWMCFSCNYDLFCYLLQADTEPIYIIMWVDFFGKFCSSLINSYAISMQIDNPITAYSNWSQYRMHCCNCKIIVTIIKYWIIVMNITKPDAQVVIVQCDCLL